MEYTSSFTAAKGPVAATLTLGTARPYDGRGVDRAPGGRRWSMVSMESVVDIDGVGRY